MMLYAATLLAFLFLLAALSLEALLHHGRSRNDRRAQGCGAPDCCSKPNRRRL